MNSASRERDLISTALDSHPQRFRLSDSQKLIIINLVNQRKNILFDKRCSPQVKRAKKDAWQDIIDECKEVYGFDAVANENDIFRSRVDHIRDHVWSDMKQRVVKLLRLKNRDTSEFTDIDLAVLDVIGDQQHRQHQDEEQQHQQQHQFQTQSEAVESAAACKNITDRQRINKNLNCPIRRDRQPTMRSAIQSKSILEQGRNIGTTIPSRGTVPRTIVGLRPVIGTNSGVHSLYLAPANKNKKRSRQEDDEEAMSEEETEAEIMETKRLKREILMAQLKHYQLLNEKLQLEIEAMRR